MVKRTISITIDHDLVEFWDANRYVYIHRSTWLNMLLEEWRRTGQEPSSKSEPSPYIERKDNSRLSAALAMLDDPDE